ncbi:MAG: NADH-quinone oxidoreductase subunit M [Anaerolineaceae bacterium]
MSLIANPLVIVTLLPLIGFILVLILPAENKTVIRWLTLVLTLLTFGISLWALSGFDKTNPNPQMEVNVLWVRLGNLDINFHLGVDGLSILLVLLTTFLMPLVILASWKSIQGQVKGYMAFFLLLETGMLGVFLSLDLILFYVFWEFSLIPMYFLIGIWGGERRVYAAVKFFLFTMAGSVLMLVAILYLGINAGTFSVMELMAHSSLAQNIQPWLFIAFGLAFAIKVPIWPLHTWLPDAHVEAPTAGSVILAAVLLKMGTYGFLRFNLGLFPQIAREAAPWLAGLAVIGILYGAVVAFMQKDVKKLVAYSSVSHLGFVILGLFALNQLGIEGAILQMVNHGLSTGALFLIVGMLYERRHTRELDAYGGLWKAMPVLGTLTLIVTLSSLGLPGLNGFIGEFTILLGAFNSSALSSFWFAGIATLGVILAAVYLLHMFQKVFLGKLDKPENKALKDITWREILILTPILVLIVWIGIYPQPFFDLISPSVSNLLMAIP